MHFCPESDISCKNVKDMEHLEFKIEKENNALPFIYNTIKQHKNPASNRFIVSGKGCTAKTLSTCCQYIDASLLKQRHSGL